eukprot:gnl/Spiro4/22912_TR11300_c0_g1_i1.p2 gnl/Spiro4/22912_TR11300_c0_g1~~gnl/Spiro4/22912_TR11300_c0_g1_i1.p2  ORF type:complete len:283 (-),score=-44.18 gnl/Spiro4/22912_TR11300_c0_g1_i1:574-1422(-)
MKTLLIPVDFSAPSNNAVDYAAGFANLRGIERIILLTNCYVSAFEQIIPSPDFVQAGEKEVQFQKSKLNHQLKASKTHLLQKLNPGITVDVVLTCEPLLRSILDGIERAKPDIIIIGSNGRNDVNESYIGVHIIELAKTSPVPVLIVPPETHYQPVTHALVPCDFRSLKRVGQLEHLKKIKNWPHPQLAVLNIDPAQKHLKDGYPPEGVEGVLKEYLHDYDYHIVYDADRNTLHGIIKFADENHLQLIIALPGQHSFLYTLTHQSISHGLAMNANQPVLILK